MAVDGARTAATHADALGRYATALQEKAKCREFQRMPAMLSDALYDSAPVAELDVIKPKKTWEERRQARAAGAASQQMTKMPEEAFHRFMFVIWATYS